MGFTLLARALKHTNEMKNLAFDACSSADRTVEKLKLSINWRSPGSVECRAGAGLVELFMFELVPCASYKATRWGLNEKQSLVFNFDLDSFFLLRNCFLLRKIYCEDTVSVLSYDVFRFKAFYMERSLE